MSSSRRSDTRADGVGLDADKVSRMLPSVLMNFNKAWGVRLGPRPVIISTWRSNVAQWLLTFRFGWEDEEVIISSLAKLEQRQTITLWRFKCDIKAPAYSHPKVS